MVNQLDARCFSPQAYPEFPVQALCLFVKDFGGGHSLAHLILPTPTQQPMLREYLSHRSKLHLTQPTYLVKATDHIKEQIDLIQMLENKGFTYQTTDGVYFDTAKFPEYGMLSDMDQIKEGARVDVNKEKLNPKDFALWKFSNQKEKRQMEWESPWSSGSRSVIFNEFINMP